MEQEIPMIRILCVKDRSAMPEMFYGDPVVIAPFRSKEAVCPTCQSTEGFLIRCLDEMDMYLGAQLKRRCKPLKIEVGDRYQAVYLSHCECDTGFSEEKLKEYIEWFYEHYKLPLPISFVGWEMLTWADLPVS